jgi:hypothetical protein
MLRAEDASDLGASNVRSLSRHNWPLGGAEMRDRRPEDAQSRIVFLVFLFVRSALANVRHHVGGDVGKPLHIGAQLREPSQHLIPFHVLQHEVPMLQTQRRPEPPQFSTFQ